MPFAGQGMHITLEFVDGGSLADLCKNVGAMGENAGSFFFRQLMDGLEYLQSKKVAHLDLKPENMLITKDLTLKLTGFGISRKILTERLTNYGGTRGYMAPEIVDIR